VGFLYFKIAGEASVIDKVMSAGHLLEEKVIGYKGISPGR
jgi:hypothetical protein